MHQNNCVTDSIREYVDAFQKTTGMKVHYYSHKRDIQLHMCEKDHCPRSIVTHVTGIEFDCAKAHREAFTEAERFGGRYVYTCPMGFVYITSHLIIDGELSGGLIGGPAAITDKEDYLFGLRSQYSLNDDVVDDISDILDNVYHCDSEHLTALSKLLFLVAGHISGLDYYENLRKQANQKLIGDIYDRLYDLKSLGVEAVYPYDKESEMLKCITEGDTITARRLLNDVLGHILFCNGPHLAKVKSDIISLIVLLSRACIKGGADESEISNLTAEHLLAIDSHAGAEQLCVFMRDVLNTYSNYVFSINSTPCRDVIYKAVAYIKSRYMHKLSLEEVAQKVHISPSYLSKVFKKERGMNFVDYLNEYRIEKSKLLLLRDELPLLEIALAVGFEDQSYYSKVFKKVVGLTPGKFRESRGRIKAFIDDKQSKVLSHNEQP